MGKNGEDLRVRKTKTAIYDTIKEMIYEMNYDQITIKELAARAQINRKTFYLHYENLDELLYELIDTEVADTFLSVDASYSSMKDIHDLVKLYFSSITQLPQLYERILCSGSYRIFGDQVSKKVMDYRKQTNPNAFGMDQYSENIVFAFCGSVSATLFRQWVEDGKQLTLSELTAIADTLICQGMSGILEKE